MDPVGVYAVALIAALAAPIGAMAASPTKASWANAANTICARANAQVERLPSPTSSRILVSDLRAVGTIATRASASLAAIPEPASELRQIEAFLAIGRRQTALSLHKLLPALQNDDSAAALRLTRQIAALGSQYNAKARALGAHACAVNPTPSG